MYIYAWKLRTSSLQDRILVGEWRIGGICMIMIMSSTSGAIHSAMSLALFTGPDR